SSQVVIGDCSLLFVILLFRAAKELAGAAFAAKDTSSRLMRQSWILSLIFFACFVLLLCFAKHDPPQWLENLVPTPKASGP
ncbi:MAG TPA: hypothetical protein VGH32_02285, partial [Pirellulales bacterium]